MANLKEQDVVLTTKDADGNTVIQMPITRAANVEDLTNTCLPLSGGDILGVLTVQGKDVVRTVNGANADASGNVSLAPSMKMPNYNAVVSVGNTTRTPTQDVVVHCDKTGSLSTGTITIGSHTFNVSKADSNGLHNHTYRSFYIAKGTTYTTVGLSEVLEIPLV